MNDTDNTQDRGLTTDQIAAAGTRRSQEDVPQSAGHDGFDDGYADEDVSRPGGHVGYADEDVSRPGGHVGYADEDVPRPAGHVGYADEDVSRPGGPAASGPADRSAPDTAGHATADPGSRASLLEDGELQSITMRWKDIQAEFVDEPEQAVQEADALVAELMQRLAAMFANERAGLEKRLAGDQQVSTEDLRQGLRRYRSFFERLLAA
jgi:hypothetical protein